MSRQGDKALAMIRRAIQGIETSSYPSSEFALGMVEAMYAMGHIGEDDQYRSTQDAFDAVRARWEVIKREAAQRRFEEVLAREERRVA